MDFLQVSIIHVAASLDGILSAISLFSGLLGSSTAHSSLGRRSLLASPLANICSKNSSPTASTKSSRSQSPRRSSKPKSPRKRTTRVRNMVAPRQSLVSSKVSTVRSRTSHSSTSTSSPSCGHGPASSCSTLLLLDSLARSRTPSSSSCPSS